MKMYEEKTIEDYVSQQYESYVSQQYEEWIREQVHEHEERQHLMADLIAVIKKMTGLRRQSEPNFPTQP